VAPVAACEGPPKRVARCRAEALRAQPKGGGGTSTWSSSHAADAKFADTWVFLRSLGMLLRSTDVKRSFCLMQAFEGRKLTKECNNGLVTFRCPGTCRGEPCAFAFRAKMDDPKTLQFKVLESHPHSCFGVGRVSPRLDDAELVKDTFTEIAIRLRASLSVTETPMAESENALDTRFILQFHNLLARDYGLLLETKW